MGWLIWVHVCVSLVESPNRYIQSLTVLAALPAMVTLLYVAIALIYLFCRACAFCCCCRRYTVFLSCIFLAPSHEPDSSWLRACALRCAVQKKEYGG
jgi:hypothetical protein